MNKQIIKEWRQFLKENPQKTQEVSDEVIKLIFSKEINDILKNSSLHENIADRAKSLAKNYGLPIAVATSLLAGTAGGKKFADYQNIKNAAAAEVAAQADAPKPGDFSYHLAKSAQPPGYSDLSNREKIQKAWNDIQDLPRQPAPVSGTAPVMIDGELKVLRFAHIPTSEMSPDTELPMSSMSATQYRKMLESRLERSPEELIYLKNMIFGDTGKWASGVGEQIYKVEGNYAILPPEWSIAHEVYASAVETRLIELVDYARENPEDKQDVYQQLGVENDDQFHEFVNDQLFKIGRQ